jgi:WD40 repeat protein
MAYDAFISYNHDRDGPVASSLQRGLQRLAKPWLRARALRVFRDDTALATNPNLWSSIEQALDDSEWFVLLASPEAATSEWVGRELDHWLASKSADHVLAVVTAGEWAWDSSTRTLLGDAVPPSLRDAFADEPRHLDLTWARDADDLDLRNSGFRGAVADLAAPMHGVPKDELESEDVRLHRRSRRIARTAATTLVILLVVSLAFGAYAVVQRDRADHNAHRAKDNALVADSSRLAAQARVVGTDQLDLSLLLAVQGRRLVRSNATDGGLQGAVARVPPGLESMARIPPTSGVVGVSPNGRLLAVPGTDDRVHLVDPRESRVVKVLEGFRSGDFASTAFDADGGRVLGAGNDRVTVWDVKAGAPLGSVPVENGPVAAVFDPADANRIFTAANGRLVHWDLRDAVHPAEVGSPLPVPGILAVDWPIMHVSRAGRLLAVGSLNTRKTNVFELPTMRLLQKDVEGVGGPFSPDGTLLATARGERIVLVDPRTGEERGASLGGFRHANPAMVISADGRYLAASDIVDDAMHVFDLTTRRPVGQPLAVFGALSFPVTFLPGERLLTADAGRTIVWRFVSSAAPLLTRLPEQPGTVSAQFTPDGSEVITVNQRTNVVHRWRAADGTYLGRMLDSRAAPVRPLGFSPDGKLAVTATPRGTAGIFDVASGALLSVLDAHQAGDLKTLWSPVAPIVALGSDDFSLTLWDVSDPHHPRLRTRLQTAKASDIASLFMYPGFSPDGRTIGAFFGKDPAVLYDVASGLPARIPIHASRIALSPDGATAAVARSSGEVAIVEVATGRTRAVFAHPPQFQTMAFTAHGTRLVFLVSPAVGLTLFFPIANTSDIAGANTLAIALYDAKTFEPIGDPVVLPGTVPILNDISRDGTRFATGADNSPEGVPAVWDLDPERWEASACRIAGRNLSRAEWDQYLPGRPYEKTCPQWAPG